MTPKERMLNALAGKQVDRIPIGGIVTSITAELEDYVEIYFPEAHKDASLMSELASAVYDVFGLESLKVPFCMTVEAEALGSTVDFGDKYVFPQVKEKQQIGREFIEKNRNIDLKNIKRIPIVLEAIRRLKKKYKDEVAITSVVVGPMSILGMLFGFNQLFYTMIDDPKLFKELILFVTDVGISYAKLQVEAGTDMIQIGEAGASGDLIGPDTYRDMVLPYHQRLCKGINVPVVMHICGNIEKNLPYIRNLDIAAISIDERTRIDVVKKELEEKVKIIGYVPCQELLGSTPEKIKISTRKCIAKGVDVLNSGCAISPYTPTVNIQAMVNAAENYFNQR